MGPAEPQAGLLGHPASLGVEPLGGPCQGLEVRGGGLLARVRECLNRAQGHWDTLALPRFPTDKLITAWAVYKAGAYD